MAAPETSVLKQKPAVTGPPEAPRRKPAWRKRLLRGVAILLGLLGLLAGVLAMAIDPLTRRGLETLAGDALEAPVDVQGARIRLKGRVDVQGMVIGNPAGYDEPVACEILSLDGFVEVPSIFRETVEIHDLVVIRPVFTVEFVDGKSNWAILIDNLLRALPEDAPTFRISRIRIREATIRFRSSLVPGGLATINLPDLELENFGDAPGTASTINLVFAVIFQTLGGGAMEQKDVPLPGDLRTSFGEEMKRASESLKDAGERK